MNKAILIGNLTRDPETRISQNGNSVCTFTLAVNRRFMDQSGNRQADFIPVVTFKKTAENCARYLAKGRKCAVVGMIQTRSYDAQDGTKRYVTEVVAEEVQFIGGQQGGGDDGQGYEARQYQSGGTPTPSTFNPKPQQQRTNTSPSFGEEEDDDELPF